MGDLAAAERTESKDFQSVAQYGSADHSTDKCRKNSKSCFCDKKQADVSAHHEDAAMCHVDDIEYAEYQRIADGNDRIGASQR